MAQSSAPQALVRLDEWSPSHMPAVEQDPPIRHLRRWLVVLVFALPVAVCVLYNFVIATPRYASDITFVVRSSDTPHDRLSILSLGQGGGIGTSDNSEAVVAYLKSRDILDVINRDGFVTRLFAKPGLDPIAAFPSLLSGNGREKFHRHFQHYLTADFDRATDIIHVQVQSFRAEDAREIAQRLLNASEAMVNRLNRRAEAGIVESANRDMAQASAQLASTLVKMNRVRNASQIIEPELNAGSSIKLQSATAGELSGIEVQLGSMLRSAPQSPLIEQLRSRRRALEEQLTRQIRAAAGSDGSLADRLRGYEELEARREIAEKQLMAASLQLVSAHHSASRQQLYLEQIAQPNLADEARYPRRWINLLLTLLICGASLWIISSLAELVFDDE